jgi:hypothetical protein
MTPGSHDGVPEDPIQKAVESVATAVEEDGAALTFDRVDEGTIHLRLVLDPTTCDVDCVVPTPVIAKMVESAVERATGTAYDVAIAVAGTSGA